MRWNLLWEGDLCLTIIIDNYIKGCKVWVNVQKSVDKYFKEMKLVMIWVNVEKDREAIMAKFMNGFNHNISHIMELHH
jgi:hypothetical protein